VPPEPLPENLPGLSHRPPGGEAGEPPNLPALPEDDELAEVVDGVIVDEPPAAPQRPVYYLRVTQVFQTINVVVRHEHTRRAARHAAYVPAGAVVAYRRWRRSRSLAMDFAHQAKAAGDHENGLKWAQHHEASLKARHDRHRERVQMLSDLLKLSPWIFGIWALLMVLTGVALAWTHKNPVYLLWPWKTLLDAVSDLWALAGVALWVLAFGVPLAFIAVLWHFGRRGGDLAPGWSTAAKPGDTDKGLVVTADTIVLALQNIPVPAMAKAFKDRWRPSFSLQPVRDGRGYEAEFSVPLGVTAEMIADRRPVLARNLHRDEIETWPSAGAPGFVRLWVADRGAIGKAAPEYPLLHDGEADVFEGVPGGVLARGDGALIPVVAANGVLGGLMGQGKSNAGRVIILGCATDPLCGIDVFVFANNGDFDAYEPRLAVYRKGLDDDVITAAVDRLHEAYADVGNREQMLADLGAKKLTRQLARQYPELRPHVSLFSECHELFGHPEYGELAGELAVKIVKRQRKTGRVAWFDTQSSRKAAIPPALVELVSVNCCFAVKSWRSNDGFLGDGSFAAGIRATELRPGRDRGTSLVTGISDAQFELLKWYFVEVDDDTGYDAAADVIARCMKTVAPGTPVAGNSPALAIEYRDLLEDLAEVIGPDRVKVADLPGRLRKLSATYPRSMTGRELKAKLDDLDVRTTNTANVRELDPADLRKAIAERGELPVPCPMITARSPPGPGQLTAVSS
jgi:DNA segregation ATPase FtsK/SpoIIIE, S-DNA-T family